VHIDNLNRVMPKGEFLPVPLLSCISIGAPIFLESGENKHQFLARARGAVLKMKPQEAESQNSDDEKVAEAGK